MNLTIIILIIALLLSVGIAYYFMRSAENERLTKEQYLSDIAEANRQMAIIKEELATTREKLIAAQVLQEQMQKHEEEKRVENEKQQIRLTTEFHNIANSILKSRSEELTHNNDERLSLLLKPLSDKLGMFKEQVEKAFDLEMRDKISLREEVKRLTSLNEQMSREANNLTKALKGDVKRQGNWGEIVLERVLESSGLREGMEYEREMVITGNNGEKQRPDVIVKLPDNKQIIVDSKVSLVAYERYVSATDDQCRDAAFRDHMLSVRSHIKLLGEKHYQNSPSLNTPDFVLLFMPIEGAFALALQSESDLYSYAWGKKIVIVSPSTLLATLRTVSSIWQQENQTKNALEIARLSGTLYDKLSDMIEDFEKVNNNIERAQKSYADVMNKLRDGRGNIFITAEKIKTLGAKTTKQLKI